MIHFVVPAAQAFGMRDYLAFWGLGVADRVRIVPYEELVGRTSLERGAYVLAALDQLDEPTLGFVRGLHARVAGLDGFRFLNHPERTLGRHALLAELHRLGWNDFRAVRATEELSGLRYPVFLRGDRTHDGALTPLLRSPREVDEGIGLLALQGRRLRDLLAVEFCPTADGDGWYRKFSAFAVGGRVVPRSLAYGREWMLKSQGNEYSLEMVLEERDYVVGNPHGEQLAEIFRVAGVEYGRIDYSLREGRIQTWEINLNPSIGRGLRPPSGRVPGELEPVRDETKEHFYRCFQAALEAVDLPSSGAPVELSGFGLPRVRVAPADTPARVLRRRVLRRAGAVAGRVLGPVRRLVLRPALLAAVGRRVRRRGR